MFRANLGINNCHLLTFEVLDLDYHSIKAVFPPFFFFKKRLAVALHVHAHNKQDPRKHMNLTAGKFTTQKEFNPPQKVP